MKVSLSSVIKFVQQPVCRYTPEIIKQNKVLTGIALVALAGIYDLYIRELWLSPEKKFKRIAPVEQFNCAKRFYTDGDYSQARKYLYLYLEKRKSVSIFQFCKHIYRMSVNYHLYRPELSRELYAMYAYASLCRKGLGGEVDDVAARTFFEKIKNYSYDRLKVSEKSLWVSSFYNYALMCKKGEGGDKDLSVVKQFKEMLVKVSAYDLTQEITELFNIEDILQLKRKVEEAYFAEICTKTPPPSAEVIREINLKIKELKGSGASFEEWYDTACTYGDQGKTHFEWQILLRLESSIPGAQDPSWDLLVKVRYRLAHMGKCSETGLVNPKINRMYYAKIVKIPTADLSEEALIIWIKVCYEYAKMCAFGVGGAKDNTSARLYFDEVVKRTPRNLLGTLGKMYFTSLALYADLLIDGKGGDVDMVRAREYYLQLASYSLREIPEVTKIVYIASLMNLIHMLKDGCGGEVDIKEAKKCFEKIAYYPREDLAEALQAGMEELQVALNKEGANSSSTSS